MQVWKRRKAYELVVQGISKKDFDAFGHSFIFMGYVHDEDNKIIGIKLQTKGIRVIVRYYLMIMKSGGQSILLFNFRLLAKKV